MDYADAYIKQRVVSSDPQDARCPCGYIFQSRGRRARVVFDDNSVRDVPYEQLTPEST